MVALAFNRGLYPYQSIDELHADTSQLVVPTVPAVQKQAVFVAATQANSIDASKPMREHPLNHKLQEMCRIVGLMERNTMYSFRRTMFTEVERSHGRQSAEDFGCHVSDSGSFDHYDLDRTRDKDCIAMRLHAEQINNAAIRAEFAQANTAIQANSIKQTLSDTADRLMMTDEAYKAMELELRDLLTLIAQRVGLEKPTARRNAHITFETYRSALKKRE